MSGAGRAFLSKGAWAGAAVVAIAAGVVALRAVPVEPRVALANPPPHDVVSRALDSELEISPSLAASHDGTLALAWIATSGGRDGDGKYVGVRISEPGAGKLGPVLRVTSPRGLGGNSDATIVPLGAEGHAFLLVWYAGGSVYSARIDGGGVAAPVEIATHATLPRAVATAGGMVVTSFVDAAHDNDFVLSTTRDGVTFARHEVTPSSGGAGPAPVLCADDHTALVVLVDEIRGVVVNHVPLDPEGPAESTVASSMGEHVASERAACFVTGQDAFVVYGITEKPQDPIERELVDSLVFVRSRDGGKNFLVRAPHRPPSRLVHPTFLHDAGSFTMLAVMGSGAGDTHASAGVIELSADGRTQNGLTRTVIAPVTMAIARDGAGYLGDSLGVVQFGGVTWTAVVDNATGEPHVALVRVL